MGASIFPATNPVDPQGLLIWFIIKAVYADTAIVKIQCLLSQHKMKFLEELIIEKVLPVKVLMNVFLIDLADFKLSGLSFLTIIRKKTRKVSLNFPKKNVVRTQINQERRKG